MPMQCSILKIDRILPWIGIVVLLATSSQVASCKSQAAASHHEVEDVGVISLTARTVELGSDFSGRVQPFAMAEVRPQVSGLIQRRLFPEGARVKASQPLYAIDATSYRLAVDEAAAKLAGAEADLARAKLRAKRYDQLVRSNFASRQTAEDANAALGQAEALAREDRAAAEAARVALSRCTIRAPISGRIGHSAITQGALVTENQPAPLATIEQLDPIYVDLNRPSADAADSRGSGASLSSSPRQVRLILPDGSLYPGVGRLEFTSRVMDPNSGTVMMRAVFPNAREQLLPGMFVRAQVIDAVRAAAILVPQQAVLHDPRGRATALVVDARHKVEARELQISRAVGSDWLVDAGLGPGDQVIVEGLQRVKPGASVRVHPAPSPPGGGERPIG